MLEKINDNAYRLDLPKEYGAHNVFTVSELLTTVSSDAVYYQEDLRTNPSQEGGNDEDTKTNDPSLVPVGLVTRARAKRLSLGA